MGNEEIIKNLIELIEVRESNYNKNIDTIMNTNIVIDRNRTKRTYSLICALIILILCNTYMICSSVNLYFTTNYSYATDNSSTITNSSDLDISNNEGGGN